MAALHEMQQKKNARALHGCKTKKTFLLKKRVTDADIYAIIDTDPQNGEQVLHCRKLFSIF